MSAGLLKAAAPSPRTLRLGFLGTGWIGRSRMEAILQSGLADAAVFCDAAPDMAEAAAALAPEALHLADFHSFFDHELDGVVIATPSAGHAEQAIAALERGVPVFCQKPLGRTAEETKRAVEAARAANRLLGVDFSYRQTEGMQAVRELVHAGSLGDVFAADLVFHNAYGPDKPWFYDPALSGGGCVTDLGIHLIDLALWVLDFPDVASVDSRLFANGRRFERQEGGVEDFAFATLTLMNGTVIRLSCSWNLHAGEDAVISCDFHGTEGGARFRNRNGSFYDFEASRHSRTHRELLCEPPDPWSGRMAAAWVAKLSASPAFDAEADQAVAVADIVDRIYASAAAGRPA